jgi:acyl carrier protein
MPDSEQTLALILEVIKDLNREREPDEQVESSAGAVLFGAGSKLDSLGLVGLIVAVEQKIDDHFGVVVTLADEKAMSLKNSPFRTVQTLADYATRLIGEQSGG